MGHHPYDKQCQIEWRKLDDPIFQRQSFPHSVLVPPGILGKEYNGRRCDVNCLIALAYIVVDEWVIGSEGDSIHAGTEKRTNAP